MWHAWRNASSPAPNVNSRLAGANRARIPHLVIVGLPGAGKSVCGARLAERLQRPFLDLDREIERRAARPIPEIFSDFGEERFRDLETEVTRGLAEAPPSVVSPGGGWIERDVNRGLVAGCAKLVYLRVSPGEALLRLGGLAATRPLLAGVDPLGALNVVLRRRQVLYEASDAELNTEVLTPEAVVDQLVRLALRWGVPVG